MYYGVFQFPNLMVNLHPDSVMAYLVYPNGPARTTVVSEFYFRPEAMAMPGFDPSPTVELWDLISRQDWTVCERAQLGVSSRAFTQRRLPAQGPPAVRLQRALAARRWAGRSSAEERTTSATAIVRRVPR